MSEEKTIERLTELLDQKEDESDELRDKIQRMEWALESAASGWSLPRVIEDRFPELPLPRLEMEWTRCAELGWRRRWVEYRLVMQHYVDGVMAIPLGKTKIEGGSSEDPFRHGVKNALPYRDGVHAMHDAAHLGLRFFAIHPDGPVELTGQYEMAAKAGLDHRREAVHTFPVSRKDGE
jgi:hypothetical protein